MPWTPNNKTTSNVKQPTQNQQQRGYWRDLQDRFQRGQAPGLNRDVRLQGGRGDWRPAPTPQRPMPPVAPPATTVPRPTLNIPQLPPFAMTFNPVFAATERQLDQQLAGLDSEQELAQRRVNSGYQDSRMGLEQQLREALKQNTINMADQGIVYSGINVGEQGRLNQGFQEGLGDLEQQKAANLEDIARQILSQRQEIGNRREQLELERAREEERIRLEEANRNAQLVANRELQRQIDELMRDLVGGQQPTPGPSGTYVNPNPGTYLTGEPTKSGQPGIIATPGISLEGERVIGGRLNPAPRGGGRDNARRIADLFRSRR